jgi:N-acetylmuramoyl-L-alanine amidase-like protein
MDLIHAPAILKGDYVVKAGSMGHQRQAMAQDVGCICVVEFHFNSFTSAVQGGEVTHQVNSAESQPFAVSMWDEIAATGLPPHGTPVRGTKSNPRAAFIEAYAMPAILLEPLFISDSRQAAWLHDPSNATSLAHAVTAGIVRHFPDGGTIGLSAGHNFKSTELADRGAMCASGADMEADHTLSQMAAVEQGLNEFVAGAWQSTDEQKRWSFLFSKTFAPGACTWTERNAIGSALTHTVRPERMGSVYRLERPNDAEVLTLLGARPGVRDQILARSPGPSSMQVKRTGVSAEAKWNGLFWTVDAHGNLDALGFREREYALSVV